MLDQRVVVYRMAHQELQLPLERTLAPVGGVAPIRDAPKADGQRAGCQLTRYAADVRDESEHRRKGQPPIGLERSVPLAGVIVDRALRQAPQEGAVVVEDMPEVHPDRGLSLSAGGGGIRSIVHSAEQFRRLLQDNQVAFHGLEMFHLQDSDTTGVNWSATAR